MRSPRIALLLFVGMLLISACAEAEPLPTIPSTQPGSTAAPSVTPSEAAQPEAEATPAPTLPTEGKAAGNEGMARGIILFIGDGMGLAQRTAGRWVLAGENGTLAMDRLQVYGWQSTGAYGAPITDSAAAATALASGQKTRNGYLGMDADGTALETILEQAKAMGWATGLVTSVPIAHATPAAFAAHVDDRNEYEEIASQMLALQVDVLLGGGEDDWLPRGEAGCQRGDGNRGDGRNLIAEAQEMGYRYVCDAEGLAALDTGATSRLLGLFAGEELQRPFQPSLAEMTAAALEILSRDADGFFLMVEGGQVDWAAHENDPEGVMDSVAQLDKAVETGMGFAAGGDVLVIVTADHETGGMSLSKEGSGSFLEDGPYLMPDGSEFFVRWSTGGHSAVDVPVSAAGPWAHWLAGYYANTFIYWVMHAALTGEAPPGE